MVQQGRTVLDVVQEGLQEDLPVQEELYSRPLPAAFPGAGAEERAVQLSWGSGERLLGQRRWASWL